MRTVRRLAAIATLLSWMAPGAAAVAVGVHLLIDDHHATGRTEAAVSHQHDVIASPAHDHEAVQSPRTTARTSAVAAAAADPLSRPTPASGTPACRITSTASPPGALFLAHCALLI